MINYLKNIFFVLIIVGFGALATKAHAIGSAGCGLGSVIFKGNEWWKQLLAVTTNGTFLSQTFGITSGTSNCAPGLFGEVQKQEDYIVANLSSLQREAATGTGDSLSGLASVLGCNAESYSAFGTHIQSKYSLIFNTQDSREVLSNLKSEIKKDDNLLKSCPLVNI